ncbi:ChaB family protein [Nostoc sp. C052]|nr:ChaB family protein [Nostoc sp. C052]
MKKHLPKHAAEIFLAAFNNALSEYGEEALPILLTLAQGWR